MGYSNTKYIQSILMGVMAIVCIFLFLFPQIQSYQNDDNIKTFMGIIFILMISACIYAIAKRIRY